MAGRVLQTTDFTANEDVDVVTMERLERRLAEECGAIRLDIKDLRAEMIDRNNSTLRWLLGFFLAQTTAIGALFAALR